MPENTQGCVENPETASRLALADLWNSQLGFPPLSTEEAGLFLMTCSANQPIFSPLNFDEDKPPYD